MIDTSSAYLEDGVKQVLALLAVATRRPSDNSYTSFAFFADLVPLFRMGPVSAVHTLAPGKILTKTWGKK
ncbi:MAG TPA: hypothetical protein VJS90_07805 [Pseudomonas sp.]|uniref:hypothetical protein n=1 Tax=Pseudomonas sp. TaxID=306 RepID=UPI002B462D65|nr:hypothetical protein [Pseudomonas sp.]HKS12932.1 hypothetical protein [Pseudomonas sp.]